MSTRQKWWLLWESALQPRSNPDWPIVTMMGVDPGLAFTGVAIAKVRRGESQFLAVPGTALLTSKPDPSRRKIIDRGLRAGDLAAKLQDLAQEFEVDCVACELPFLSHRRAADFDHGLTLAAVTSLRLPMTLLTPYEVKRAATGDHLARKKAMMQWALNATEAHGLDWPTSEVPNELGLTYGNKQVAALGEHLADALAVINGAIKSAWWRDPTATPSQW